MNDTRAFEQKYQSWVDAVNLCWKSGWTHSYGWVFESPKGTKHDLSAADLTKLDMIQDGGLFLVQPDKSIT